LRLGCKAIITSVTIPPQAFTSLTNMDTFIQNSCKFDQNSDVLRLQTDYGQAMALLNYSATKDQASAHRYQYL